MDIDNLKDLWQEENNKKNYETPALLKMLNISSMNYIKYILWISIAEFCVILGINIFSTFNIKQSEKFFKLFSKYHIPFSENLVKNYDSIYEIFNYLSLALSCIFIYLFYKSYKNIRIDSSIKQFIQQIVKVKYTVNLFIAINFVYLVLISLFFIIYPIYLVVTQVIHLNEEIYLLIGTLIVVLLLSLFMLYLYYRLIYGIVLNKLTKNLKQLNKIEFQNTLNT